MLPVASAGQGAAGTKGTAVLCGMAAVRPLWCFGQGEVGS